MQVLLYNIASILSRKTILNYETNGLIEPDKKEGSTGNRYYTIDTFTKVRTIRILQDLGLTLKEIREYYNGETDLLPMIKRLEKMRDELNLTIEKLKERTDRQGDSVRKITIEPQTIYCRTYNSTSIADKTNLLRDTALEAMRKHGTDTTKRMYYTEFSLKNPADISYCVIVPKNSEGEYDFSDSYYPNGKYNGYSKLFDKSDVHFFQEGKS